jgi:putative pyruvate formate lyase activating enzyme
LKSADTVEEYIRGYLESLEHKEGRNRVGFEPGYVTLHKNGELEERIEKLFCILRSCELCARKCKVNRLEGERGYCQSRKELVISSYGPHFGEEPELVGIHGSGTIFLTNCNLLCIYCQNYEISHLGEGEVQTEEKVADHMIRLQGIGCHNINLVTPTHFTPQLVRAIAIAAGRGLRLPIVWNCGGYENVETIKLLDGIVDIYMPDIKYSDGNPAKKYSDAPDYFERSKESVSEMHRQVGDLKLDGRGIAYRGLLVRHLVLPNGIAGSDEVLKFAAGLSKDTYVNIMDQYRPCGEAYRYKELNRRPTPAEYGKAVATAKALGLHRGFRVSISHF